MKHENFGSMNAFAELNMKMLNCLFVTLLFAAMVARADDAKFVPIALEGDTFTHDPSTIIKDGGSYYVYWTGKGIFVKSSPDLIHWTERPPIFTAPPAWTTNVVPAFRGLFWAPDIIRLNGKFYLYYAVSTWGKQVSAIGLATSPALDPAAPNYGWTDHGMVIRSTNGSDYNTIDPSIMQDDDGRVWMAFGSYCHGIYLTELDAKTGLRAAGAPAYPLAWNYSIEA